MNLSQWIPFVIKPSSNTGWQAWSNEIRHTSLNGNTGYMGLFSYFSQRVRFLLAPSANMKWDLSVAGFTVLLSVSLETYISFQVGHLYMFVYTPDDKGHTQSSYRICSANVGIVNQTLLSLSCESRKYADVTTNMAKWWVESISHVGEPE